MANELDYVDGVFPISVGFGLANVATNSTVDLALDGQGNTGYVVPTGYQAHPVALCAASNAALTTGQTLTFKVIDDGTELNNGPEAALTDSAQRATGVARVGVEPAAAGSVLGVSVTSNTTGAATHDVDAVLSFILTAA